MAYDVLKGVRLNQMAKTNRRAYRADQKDTLTKRDFVITRYTIPTKHPCRLRIALVADYVAARGWGLGATLAHVSSSFDDAANSRRLEGYVTVDLRASVPIGRRLALYGRVTNLFDATYETASFYGQPGRQAFVGIRAAL